jgi:hypothetical protein
MKWTLFQKLDLFPSDDGREKPSLLGHLERANFNHCTTDIKSKSCYDWRSVSQYVLVSSLLWNLWPDIIFCLKVAVLPLWGSLSDERFGLSPVSHCHQCLVHCQRFNIIYIVYVTCFKYMQYILDLCQHRLSTAWTVVRLTAAKFKPLMFSV